MLYLYIVETGIYLIPETSHRDASAVSSDKGFTHGQSDGLSNQSKSDKCILNGLNENHPGKKFTGILPKTRFYWHKWLINMLGEPNMGIVNRVVMELVYFIKTMPAKNPVKNADNLKLLINNYIAG